MGPLARCRNLNLGGDCGSEKSFHLGCVLKVEQTVYANKLDMGLRERNQG